MESLHIALQCRLLCLRHCWHLSWWKIVFFLFSFLVCGFFCFFFLLLSSPVCSLNSFSIFNSTSDRRTIRKVWYNTLPLHILEFVQFHPHYLFSQRLSGKDQRTKGPTTEWPANKHFNTITSKTFFLSPPSTHKHYCQSIENVRIKTYGKLPQINWLKDIF